MSVQHSADCRFLEQGCGFNDISRVQFYADVTPTKSFRHEANRARAEEGIEHELAGVGRGEDTWLDESLREGGNMCAAGIQSVDVPNRSAIARTAIARRLLHCFMVVAIALGLGEHEKIFMRAGRTVFHTLGSHIWFVPYDVAAEKPPVVLQSQRQPPRDAKQILILQSRRIVRAHVHCAVRIFLVRRAPSPIAARVAIANIEPENAVWFEDTIHLGKNIGQGLNEACERWLQADLSGNAIVAQAPVRRGSNHALHGLAGQPAQREMHIALDHNGI